MLFIYFYTSALSPKVLKDTVNSFVLHEDAFHANSKQQSFMLPQKTLECPQLQPSLQSHISVYWGQISKTVFGFKQL